MRKIFFLCALCASVLTANATQGALKGKFTINAGGDQVQFSQGNLQYIGGTWQFATNQWDIIGSAQADDNRDLFGWGTGDAPNKVSADNSEYASFSDWGTNSISNGGNEANVWRTLTSDEWRYLFCTRTDAATLFALGTVNGVNGTILLPDNWTLPSGASFTASTTKGLTLEGDTYINHSGDNFEHNIYTAEQWGIMESNGAVFLPTGGYRRATYVYSGGGVYWSATPNGTEEADCLSSYTDDLTPQESIPRSYGHSVRLVQAAPKNATGVENIQKSEVRVQKVVCNGQLLIERDGKIYNALGTEVN